VPALLACFNFLERFFKFIFRKGKGYTMKKAPWLALPIVAGTLLPASAFAQNVEIYGRIDTGFSKRSDNVGKAGSKGAVDSGITGGNRLGFRGKEDLGGGTKALFVLESGWAADTGEQLQGGRLFGRQAFVGLSGGFGQVVAGRMYSPRYRFLSSSLDPFAAGTVGRYRNVFGAGKKVGGENLFDPTRIDNAVAWTTPSFGGFNLTTAYSTNILGPEGSLRESQAKGKGGDANDGDARLISFLPRYKNGPWDVGLSFHRIDFKQFKDPNGMKAYSYGDITNWFLGGKYDFGFAQVSAFYDVNRWKDAGRVYSAAANPNDDIKLRSWMLAAAVPYGKHSFLASWTQSKLSGVDGYEGTARQAALGWKYAFSKRTSLFAAWADMDNRGDRKDFGKNIYASVGDASNSTTDGYQRGFQFGMAHWF
jgi:predicted porin